MQNRSDTKNGINFLKTSFCAVAMQMEANTRDAEGQKCRICPLLEIDAIFHQGSESCRQATGNHAPGIQKSIIGQMQNNLLMQDVFHQKFIYVVVYWRNYMK